MEKLVGLNVLTRESIKDIAENHTTWLNETLKESSKDISEPTAPYLAGKWSKMKQAEASITRWDTGVELDLLRFVGEKSVQVPPNFVRIYLIRNISMYNEKNDHCVMNSFAKL